jgi:hypothetical protein
VFFTTAGAGLAAAPHHVVLSIHFLPSAIVPPTIKAAAAAPRISLGPVKKKKTFNTLYARSNAYKALHLCSNFSSRRQSKFDSLSEGRSHFSIIAHCTQKIQTNVLPYFSARRELYC